MTNLNALAKSILADGKIDSDEVTEIRKAIYADGKIDEDEANFLFDLNDKCSGAKNDPAWPELFATAICSFLLEDLKSPGAVDATEASWLLTKIQGDGKVDEAEQKLLTMLSGKAKSMPENLRAFIAKSV